MYLTYSVAALRLRAYQTAAERSSSSSKRSNGGARVHRVDIQNSTSCGESHERQTHIFKICSLDGSQPETQTQTQTTAESATARRPPHTQYHAVDIVDVDVAVVGDLWERALSAEQSSAK